jgi:hypothetical protein
VKEKQFIGETLDNLTRGRREQKPGRVKYAKTVPVKLVGKLGSWVKKYASTQGFTSSP